MANEQSSMTRQLIIFMCVNITIVAVVAIIVLNNNPLRQDTTTTTEEPALVQGEETSNDQMQSLFKSQTFGVNFTYPQDWGNARVVRISNACDPSTKTEVVTFTKMRETIAIEINPCLTGISGFLQDKTQILSNRDENAVFFVSEKVTVTEPIQKIVEYSTGSDVEAPVKITLFTEQDEAENLKLRSALEALIYSLQLK